MLHLNVTKLKEISGFLDILHNYNTTQEVIF